MSNGFKYWDGENWVDVAVSYSDLETILQQMQIRIPVVTSTQRDDIEDPQEGMLIYNTTTSKLNIYTTSWIEI